MFVALMFCLNLLKSQPLVSVGQINDAAVSEAVLLQDVLQDMVVPMGVGAQVGHLFVAPLQAGVRHAFACACARQPVDDAVGRRVVHPFPFMNMRVSRLVAPNKGKSPDNLSGVVCTHIAVAVLDVCQDYFFGRIVSSPLPHVPAFPHDAFGFPEDVRQDIRFL